MSSTSTPEAGGTEPTRTGGEPVDVPAVADWLVAGLLALLGGVLLVAGTAILASIDEAMFVDMVASGDIYSSLFAEADLASISYATAWWTGIGLLVTGLATWAAAVGYLLVRRSHRRALASGEVPSTFGRNAFLGGVAAVFLFFVPFSQVLGGLLAGYLEQGDGTRGAKIGLLAGVFSAAPIALLLVFVLGGVAVGAATAGAASAAMFVAVALLAILFVLVFAAGLGAIGGYIGTRISPGPAPGAA